MTAEVAIMNCNAIALAADSAVTVGNQKIYNSALKVFALSKVAPVGIMVFGNASLVGVPWETIIKEYRKKLDGRTYPVLENYADDFFAFLRKSKKFFPAQATDHFVFTQTGSYFHNVVKERLEAAVKELEAKNGTFALAEVNAEFVKVVDATLKELEGHRRTGDFSADYERKLPTRFKKPINQAMSQVFENLKITPSCKAKLLRISALVFCRDVFSSLRSGVVIAGFGESEIYPSVATYDVEGVVDGRIRFRLDKSSCDKMIGGNHARIIPFAQKDMVVSFMEGVSPELRGFISKFLNHSFSRLPELMELKSFKLPAATIKKIEANFQDKVKQLFKDFQTDLAGVIREGQVDPIMSMVSVLPKDELAAMAEALVNLTAFKRKMSESMETVGGPIDVAVISKGDGLVWVKRKHYFPAQLNQHFFANYFRGMKAE